MKAFYICLPAYYRYSGAPVDFETIEISGSMNDPDVMRDALLSVGRNGVAIKGNIVKTVNSPHIFHTEAYVI